MNFGYKCVAILGLSFFIAPWLSASETYSRPKYHLGFTDFEGRMLLWTDVAPIRAEDGRAFPLRLCFSTKEGSGTSIFGKYWHCPLLESSLVPNDEQTMIWKTLGGRTVYLQTKKDRTLASSDGRVVVRNVSPSELSLVSGGNEYRYVSGKLRGLKLSGGLELEWVYQGSKLTGISKRTGGSLLTLEYAADNALPSALVIGKERMTLSYQQVPIFLSVMGQTAVAGYTSSLKEIRGPMKWMEFPISLGPSGHYVMNLSSDLNTPHRFVWDAANGILKSEGDWTYEVVQDREKGPLVSRTNKSGGVESYFYDAKTGISEHRLPDGTKTVRSYFISVGPTQYKIRKATTTKNGKDISSRQWSYDEHGRLVRDRVGSYERAWAWHPDGTLMSEEERVGDRLLKRVTFDEQGRLAEKVVKGSLYRYAYDGGNAICMKMEGDKVLNIKVIDALSGEAAFFRKDEAKGVLKGGVSVLPNAMSEKKVENARVVAMKSIVGILNEKGE